MNQDGADKGRRRLLTGAAGVVGGAGVAFTAVPFLAYWNPSARTKAAGAPVEVDVSKLEDGQRLTVEWRGKPIWIVRRTERMLDTLPELNEVLADPESKVASQQPAYAQNIHRSIKPEYLVMVGICTHLGCSPSYRPEPGSISDDWLGGFFCPCHGSKFDLAGRVYQGVPAPTNMVVPPYSYIDDNTVLVGSEEGAA
jgi:ubiquinol-cytochrome c reductase iron-sulfur subunit